MRTLTTTIFVALALSPAAVQAEEAGNADSIVVTATRSETKLFETGKSISVIDAATIEQRQTLSVADLLRTTAGVTIARNGGPGGFSSIFIRGASSEQTVALIDGVKINDPASPGGGFNFADLLTDNLDRIEILRGPQSVLWGSRAIGGVINIITRAPTDAIEARASGEYGGYDQGHANASVTGRAGPVGFSAGAGYLTTEGFSTAANGTEKDGYHIFGANLNTETRISDAVSLDLRGYYTGSRVDLDGFVFLPPSSFVFADTGDYQRQEQIVGYAGLNAALFDGRLKNRLAASYTLVDRQTYPGTGGGADFDGRGRNLRFEYQGIADLGLAVATFGAEHEQERFRTASIFSPAVAREKANTDSAYLDLHAKPIAGLNVGAGIRYDDHSTFGDATTLSADAAYSPNGGATVVRASYGEGFKAPTLFQLFDSFSGTPGLRPEKAKGWDAGIEQSALDGAVQVRATVFSRRTVSQIDYDLLANKYLNIARARARGVELELRVTPTEQMLVTANYSFTNARNRARADMNFGKQLARRPRQTVNMTLDYEWAFGLRTGATITHVGKSFDDPGNRTRLGDYVLIDLRAALPLTENIEITGRIENLFDDHYQTAAGYRQAGRAAYAGARLRY